MLAGFENVVPTDDRLQLIDDDGLSHSQDGANSSSTRPASEIAPLQLEGHPEAERSKKKSQQEGLKAIIIGSICFSISITVALILTIYLAPPPIPLHGGVVSDSLQCSELGTKLLRRGGSAVDAAIATVLCVGLVNPLHSGIGGGGIMLLRNQKKNTSVVIDFMDSAPDVGVDIDSTQPGSTVAVPGMLKGLETAHSKFGKISWKDVIMTVVDFASPGINISIELSQEIANLRNDSYASDELKDYFPHPATAGSMMHIDQILGVLQQVANHGADAFYQGSVAQDLVTVVTNAKGSMTVQDLMKYTVNTALPIQSTFLDMSVETVPSPSGGPLLLLLLNTLEGVTRNRDINFNSSDILHYVIESMKFAFAHQYMLKDPLFLNETQKEQLVNIISKDFAGILASRIDENTTYVNESFYAHDGHGIRTLTELGNGSHVSVIGPDDEIVSVSVGLSGAFGSGLVTNGIVLNSHMLGFKQLAIKRSDIKAGMRPVVSFTPSIIYNPVRSCDMRVAVGATQGNVGISDVAQVIFNIVGFHKTLKDAIEAPRVYDPLIPEKVELDDNVPEIVNIMLREKGHADIMYGEFPGVVHGLGEINQTVYGHADHRGGVESGESVF